MSRWRRLASAWLAAATLAHSAPPEEELDFAARDAELGFERAGLLNTRSDANPYLQAVLRRLLVATPDAGLADCRVYLLKGGKPNAFALPNCRLYVSTALFMTLQNDAQLAAVLAREIAHVQLHSALKQRVALDQASNWAKALSVAFAAGFGTGSGGSTGKDYPAITNATGDLIWRVSVRGYSSELERAADESGVARFKAAGYAAPDAVRALALLCAAAPDKPASFEPLLSSAKHLAARLESLRQITGATSAGAAPASAEHAALIAGLRLEQIQVLLDAGEYAGARDVLAEQVAAVGQNGVTYFLAGELARRAGAGSRAAALMAYEQGATFADAPAQLFLSQGLMLREDHEHARARLAFERYLALEPQAVEAALIRDYLLKPLPSE